MNEKKEDIDTKRCNYHLCRKETKLYKCKYCGRYFCKKHLRPKLVLHKSFIESTKDRVLKDKLYEEWRRKDGHPDPVWTAQFWEKMRQKEKNEKIELKRSLDKILSGTSEEKTEKTQSYSEADDISSVTNKKEVEEVLTPSNIYTNESLDENKKKYIHEIHKKRLSRFSKIKIKMCVMIIIIFLFFYFLYAFFEKNEVFIANNESNTISTCNKSFHDYIEKQKLKFSTNFTYRITDIKEFENKEEAEKWVRENFPSVIDYKICETSIDKLKVIVYEIIFPTTILGTKELIDVFYCDKSGKELERCKV